MDDESHENSDRQIIEEYLKLYCIEEILDETINDIIERRPTNPYVEISKLIEAKTMPEVIEVTLHPILGGCCACGIEASVMTNLGPFTGRVAFPIDIDDAVPKFEDFTVSQVKIDDALKKVDPREMSKVDELLQGLAGVDPAILLAVSIACSRAGARHKGQPLYQYISELTSTEPRIPLPIPTVLSRTVGDLSEKRTQTVHMYPISASSLDSSLETLLQAGSRLYSELAKQNATLSIPSSGCMQVAATSMEETLTLVMSALDETEEREGLAVKVAVDYKGGNFVKISQEEDGEKEIVYTFNGDEPTASGTDVVENIISQWKEFEVVAIEDPLHVQDIPSLRNLKGRITETIDTLKADGSTRELNYSMGGVGGDDSCHIQIIADTACKNPEEMRMLANEAVFDAIKIRLEKVGSISNAIEMCKTAREIGWGIVIACAEESPETTDTFISDFAVGVGAGQFMGGGLHSLEYGCKYNRLLEIRREDEAITFIGTKFRR